MITCDRGGNGGTGFLKRAARLGRFSAADVRGLHRGSHTVKGDNPGL